VTEGLALILFTIYTVGMVVYHTWLTDIYELYGIYRGNTDVRALKVAFWPVIFAFFVIVGAYLLVVYIYRRFKGG